MFGLAFVVAIFGVGFGASKVYAAIADPVINPELTAAAQGADRAADFLDWSFKNTLKNTNLSADTSSGTTTGSIRSALSTVWWSVFKLVLIIYVALAVVIAFGYILKANWLDKWKRYIPWLVISLVVSAFSFVIALAVINLADTVITALIKTSATNFIKVDGNFSDLQSSADINNIEIVNNTITLLKVITYTSYAIGGIMVLRAIILWMMVVILPLVFPFIAFPATQALGKTWLREFIRWLLYGILVAFFLYASNQLFTAITTSTSSTSTSTYDDATNISLNLPGSSSGAGAGSATSGATGTVADATTYSQYLASIIMLWASIVLPWFLMRYAISFTSESSANWLERNRSNPRFQQLLRAIMPQQGKTPAMGPIGQPKTAGAPAALRVPPLRTIDEKQRQSVIAPATPAGAPVEGTTVQQAGDVNLPAEAIKPPTLETGGYMGAGTVGSFATLRPQDALQAVGLSQLGAAEVEIKEGRRKNEPLSKLAQVEQNPAKLAQVTSDVNALREPEKITSEIQKRQITNLKNNILSAGGSSEVKDIAALVRNDVAPIAGQNIVSQLNAKNIESVKEKTRKLIESKKITNQNTVNDLQSLEEKITKYQSIPSYKTDERQSLASQIKIAAKAITSGQPPASAKDKDFEERLGGFTAPTPGATRVKPESELTQSEEGKDLLNSIGVLSAAEVAGAASSGGVDALLSESEDIGKTVADQKTNDDFNKTKKQWEDYYKNTPVPVSDNIKNRTDWIKQQVSGQEEILQQITTGDFDARKKALNRLEKIMPFLLMGNYSLLEISLYLKAKIAGAYSVLDEINKPSSGPPGPQEARQPQHATS